MTGLFKLVIRLALIGGITLVGATLIAGPDRMHALYTSLQDKVEQAIDDNIDDPAAMRRQLRDLEKQYPARISQVRGDLAELNEQIRQIEREKAVAERVVELADEDLLAMDERIDRVQGHVTATADNGAHSECTSARLELDQAFQRAGHIKQTQAAYSARAMDAERDLGYLQKQATRLEELLAKLESERARFQAQIWQLDRQVDAMARNERLIGMMEKRQETIEELGRYRVHSLDQLEAKLSEIRARQEATLDVLANTEQQYSYEDRAKLDLDFEAQNTSNDWDSQARMSIRSVSADQLPHNF